MEITSLRIIITIAGITALAYYHLFIGQFYAIGDMRDVFIPMESFFQEEQLAGRLPTWNPDMAWGFPTIASAQIGFFYPPLLIARMLLPLATYISLLVFGHIFGAILGTYIFARIHDVTRHASLIAGICFGLGGFITLHLTHMNIVFAAAWLPWQLVVMHKLAQNKIKAGHALLAAPVFAVPFLIGQLQIPLMIACVSALYYITRYRTRGVSVQKSVSVIIFSALLAVGLAAVQLMPTAELALHSSRSANQEFTIERANQHSYPVYHVPTLLFPRFFGNDATYWGKRLQIEYGFYIGTIPLILAFIGFRKTDRFIRWLLIISFLLALGSLSPFRLLGLEPSLWYFSAPARWLLFTSFALSLSAAHGLDALSSTHEKRTRIRIISTILIFATLSANIVLFWIQDQNPQRILNYIAHAQPDLIQGRSTDYYTQKIETLQHSIKSSSVSLASPYTLLPLVLLVSLPYILQKSRTTAVLTSITAAELIILAATTTPASSWKEITAPPDSIRSLPADVQAGQARVHVQTNGGDTGALLTNPDSRANASIRKQQREQLVPLIHAQFNIPGVSWPASLDLAGHSQILDTITLDNAGDYNIGALLTDPSQTTPTPINAKPRAQILQEKTITTYTTKSPTHTHIETSVKQPSTLLIRDTFYPGWKAYINGKKTPMRKAENIFRAIDVPAGHLRIDLKYTSPMVIQGLLITTATLTLIAGVGFLSVVKKRQV